MKLNIRKLRRKKKLSIVQLSKRSGIAQGYLSELESAKYRNPSANVLCKLSKVLDCTLDELVDCEREGDG